MSPRRKTNPRGPVVHSVVASLQSARPSNIADLSRAPPRYALVHGFCRQRHPHMVNMPFLSTSPSNSNNSISNTTLLGLTVAATAVAAGTAWLFHRKMIWQVKGNKRDKQVSSLPPSSFQDGSQEALVEQRFQMCVVRIKPRLSQLPTAQQLDYYGLFKQATLGDYDDFFSQSSSPQAPSKYDIVATKKWHAWQSRKGMSRVAAMQDYIDKVVTLEFTREMMHQGDADDDDLEGEAVLDMEGMGNHVSTLAAAAGGGDDEDNDELLYSSTHPIHLAARRGNADELQALLEAATDSDSAVATLANTTDDAGQSPLHLAADQGHLKCLQVLVLNGANIHSSDHDGISVLQAAVIAGCLPSTSVLLALGADPDQADHDGDTPRSEAQNEGLEMRQLFEDQSSSKRSHGKSVLDPDFMQQLKQKGINLPIPKEASRSNSNANAASAAAKPNLKEELKKLNDIPMELDDDGDM